MTSVIPKAKLKFWLENRFNVLLEGKHGVGKTMKVRGLVKKKKLKALYFSCATLDPWVDFIGIPMKAEKDGVSYLELIRPKAFAFDTVEFIFLDELNRAPPKVQNAVLELVQFGSINGKKFKNLKMIWGAINPPPKKNSDTSYHVEELDPALITRFQVRFRVPFKIDEDYFVEKHGEKTYNAINSFWEGLPEGLKDEFPPRSVDYALDMLKAGGDVEDCLPEGIPKTHFMRALDSSGVQKKKPNGTNVSVKEVFNTLDPTKIRSLLSTNKDKLGNLTNSLSNEEFIKLFYLAGVTSNRLTVHGKRLIEVTTKPQVEALAKAGVGGKLDTANKSLFVQKVRQHRTFLNLQAASPDAAASDSGDKKAKTWARPSDKQSKASVYDSDEPTSFF